MLYKNIAGTFFGLVTKHACDRRTDGRTDRITTPKTALAQLRRAVKMMKPGCGAKCHEHCNQLFFQMIAKGCSSVP